MKDFRILSFVWLFLVTLCSFNFSCTEIMECAAAVDEFQSNSLDILSVKIIPSLEGKIKGDAGRIGVIGGSLEYTGAPYFAAISALKVGADLVYVITTESAAPVIKSYSPDLIVYPFLNSISGPKINSLLSKIDVIVIGPGLGRDDSTIKLFYEIIDTCKVMKKPLIIDADGLYAVSKNTSILNSFPKPGVILTPNSREHEKLIQNLPSNTTLSNYWGENVSVLIKGHEDKYETNNSTFNWSLIHGGSGRRAGGQGDILAGALGTFFNWALKSPLIAGCDHNTKSSIHFAQSLATYAAAKFTRACNAKSYSKHGRSMTASDMINEIHSTFDEVFSKG